MKTDWARLEHAHGNASDVPHILDMLTPTPWTDEWDTAWSRLCHQGTVYSASLAALPVLCDLARSFGTRERVSPRFLASAIVSSTDVTGVRSDRIKPYEDAVPALASITEDTLAAFPDVARRVQFTALKGSRDALGAWPTKFESRSP